uniref:aldose 1-epimerase n=1 Tax=Burkholderia arboris TaxID=488730 RepID=UPI003BEF32E3
MTATSSFPPVTSSNPCWLTFERIHILNSGRLLLGLAPTAGGRMMFLKSVRDTGEVLDWLAPVSDRSIAEGFDSRIWPKAGSYPLLPFSNRIRVGRFDWQGRQITLATPDGLRHPMHGIAHRRPWRLESATATVATLDFRYTPEAGEWPWPFFASQTFTISADAVDVLMTLRNDGETRMPAGGGFHPYFRRTSGTRIRFAATDHWVIDDDEIATCRVDVVGAADFSSLRALPGQGLSVYYGGWQRGVQIRREDGSCLSMTADAPLEHLVLHAPEESGYFCAEPVTHVSDAVNLSAQGWDRTGLRVLEPGETLRLKIRIAIQD